MRNPNRIHEFCDRLAAAWQKYPDFRFGQFMINLFREMDRDPWFYEDEDMIKYIEDWMNNFIGGNE